MKFHLRHVISREITARQTTGISLFTLALGFLGLTACEVQLANTAANALQADDGKPTILSVSTSMPAGAYGAATRLPLLIEFSEPVTVHGSPVLALKTGALGHTAHFASGSGTAILEFDYTVASGDDIAPLEYLGNTALSLPSDNDLIQSVASGQHADLTLPAPGAAGSLSSVHAVTIDTIAPTVTITAKTGQATLVATLPVEFQLNFSEPINPASLVASSIHQTGTATGVTWQISDLGDHTHFTLAAVAVTGDGTLLPSLAAGDARDLAGNPSAAAGGPTITYFSHAPSALS